MTTRKVDVCDRLEGMASTVHGGAYAVMHEAIREIKNLRAWIATQGEQSDTCTRLILGRVCSTCRCGKKEAV